MSHQLEDLLKLMRNLRDPQHGCDWDLQQTFDSILPYTLEEAYEVADAIERKDFPHLEDELGDLLLQVVFYAQMGAEQGYFDFASIVKRLIAKLLRRHPHVFPSGQLDSFATAENRPTEQQIKRNWERIKQEERAAKQTDSSEPAPSILADVPVTLPGLNRALKLQKRAATVGFDWPYVAQVIDKIKEEIAELEEAIELGDESSLCDELGDVLFCCANISRHLKIDPEQALRHANKKFSQRFNYIEQQAQQQQRMLDDLSLEEMEALWQVAKQKERDSST